MFDDKVKGLKIQTMAEYLRVEGVQTRIVHTLSNVHIEATASVEAGGHELINQWSAKLSKHYHPSGYNTQEVDRREIDGIAGQLWYRWSSCD